LETVYSPQSTVEELAERLAYYEQLVDNPSPAALEHAKAAKPAIVSPWPQKYDARQNGVFHYTVHNQSHFYWDELAESLHGPEEAFNSLMTQLAEENPTRVYYGFKTFEPYISEDLKQRAINIAANDDSFIAHNFHWFANRLDTDTVKQYANQNIGLRWNNLDTSTMLRTLVEADAYDVHQKKLVFEEYLMADKIFPFTRNVEVPSNVKESKFFDKYRKENIENLRTLVAQGIADPEKIKRTLDERVSSSIVDGDSFVSENFRVKAAGERLILTQEGIIPLDEDKTLKQLTHEFLQLEFTLPSAELCLSQAVLLVKRGRADLAFVREVVGSYDATHYTSLVKMFDDEMADEDSSNYTSYLNFLPHKNTPLIDTYYQKHIENGQPLDEIEYRAFHRHILCYEGDESEKKIRLIEAYLEQSDDWIRFYSSGAQDQLSMAFDGQLDRFKAILQRRSREFEGFSPAYDDLDTFIQLMDFSDDEARSYVRQNLRAETHPENLVNHLRDLLNNKSRYITRLEAAEILHDALAGKEIDRRALGTIVAVCKSHIGKALTTAYIYPLFESQPQLKRAFAEVPPDFSNVLCENAEYYDIFEAAKTNDAFLSEMSTEQLSIFAANISNLHIEHLADALRHAWRFLNDQQKNSALERIYKNPALLALEASSLPFKSFVREVGHDRLISSSPGKDKLALLAPLSYASYNQGLELKSLPYETQLLHRNAAYIFQYRLETSRVKLHFEYAYHYDLASRLERLEDAELLMKRAVGPSSRKYGEKNELRALETLVLIHEAAGVNEVAKVKDLSKSELEALALQATAGNFGLSVDQSAKLLDQLHTMNVDTTKFAMWLHASQRSKKLETYFKDFMLHISEGGNVESWKSKKHVADNVSADFGVAIRDRWVKDYSVDSKLAGKDITVEFTNDLNTILQSGSRPINNCLHYAYGLNQRGLVGLLNTDSKLLNIQNHRGNPIGNAVIRLAQTKQQKPVLYLEPLYTSEHRPIVTEELHLIAVKEAENYAETLGLPLFVANSEHVTGLIQAAKTAWQTSSPVSTNAYVMPSLAPYTYIDYRGLSQQKALVYAIKNAKSHI
jgi:hypothetical protein